METFGAQETAVALSAGTLASQVAGPGEVIRNLETHPQADDLGLGLSNERGNNPDRPTFDSRLCSLPKNLAVRPIIGGSAIRIAGIIQKVCADKDKRSTDRLG